jgi:hypothetical protein
VRVWSQRSSPSIKALVREKITWGLHLYGIIQALP